MRPHCVYCQILRWCHKNKAKKEKLNLRPKGLDSLNDGKVYVTSDLTLAQSPPHAFGTNSTCPYSSRSPQFYGCQWVLSTSLRSLFLTHSFRRIPLTNRLFHFGLQVLRENWKCLVISCFFVPFFRALFNPMLILVRDVDQLTCQGGGCLLASSFLALLHTAWMHLRTYRHIYIPSPNHTFIMTHTNV